jgi:hypothetical protein
MREFLFAVDSSPLFGHIHYFRKKTSNLEENAAVNATATNNGETKIAELEKPDKLVRYFGIETRIN